LPVLARLAEWQVERSWSGMDGMRSAATAAKGLELLEKRTQVVSTKISNQT